MTAIHNAYLAFLFILVIVCIYAVGGWADTLWATCTDGKTINKCRVVSDGIIINGKKVNAHLLDVSTFGDELRIFYKEIK